MIIRTDFCCNCVFVIIGLSKVITSPDKPDIRTEGAESRLTLWGTSDSANNAIYEADGPSVYIYINVKSWMDLCLIWNIYYMLDSVYSHNKLSTKYHILLCKRKVSYNQILI